MNFKSAILLALLFLPSIIFAQFNLEGQVIDENKESLAFVNITINGDDSEGVIADIDGRFSIENKTEIKIITLSYVGYETLNYNVSAQEKEDGNLVIQMQASAFGLNEVVVNAGENPAHRIIKEAVKNRKQNNHEWLSTYQCEVYTKAIVGYQMIDSLAYEVTKKKWEEEREENEKEKKKPKSDLEMFDIHVFMSEVVSERKFKFPETVKTKLLHNRVSGMKSMDLSMINSFQQFTFYDDFIRFSGEEFVNPISKGSTQLYFFNIEDTLYQATDTIFLISFKPKKGKIFEGLKGAIYINTNGYAIQNVWAEPADADKISWKLEHKYTFQETENWFPDQLNFEIIIPDPQNSFANIKMIQKSYISKIQINPTLTFKDLKDDYVPFKGDVISREDSIWNEHRIEPLSQKDILSYEVMDSLGEKMQLDKIMNGLMAFSTGRFGMKGVDLLLRDVLKINDYEGARLGLGFQTNKDFSRYISFGAAGGYGFKDKKWKYKGNVVIDVIPDDILELKYEYKNDLLESGLFSFESVEDFNPLGRGLYAQIMNKEEKHALSIQSRYQFLRTSISLNQSKLKPLYDYAFDEELPATNSEFNFTELSVQLRYAFGENTTWYMGMKVPTTTKYPIAFLGYTKGFKGLLGGDIDYHKITLAVEQRFNARFLGETSYRIEGGLIKNDLLYSKLFVASGIGGTFSSIGLENSFQAMKNYEFVADKFVNVYLEHDFGNILIRHKYSRPRLIVLHNMGYGTLDKPELHRFSEESTVKVQDWSKGYFESGVGLDNLVVVPVLKMFKIGFGARVYYRYGAYQLEKTMDNIAVRWSMNIVF